MFVADEQIVIFS